MRKLVLFMHLSLDGYASDATGGLSWIPYNEEMQQYAESIVAEVGSPVYGRNTYELMAGYWPAVLEDPNADGHTLAHAKWLQSVKKVVISTTMTEAKWHNALLIKENLAAEIQTLKEAEGKDLVIFGSPGLAKSLLSLGLIDEFRFTICPVILGAGKSIFESGSERVKLELVSSKALNSGIIVAHYTLAKQ